MHYLLRVLIIMVVTISNSFASDIVINDYISNGKKYISTNHPKSLGINLEIKYPSDWVAEEGNRPHIVQKFIDKKQNRTCLIFIQQVLEKPLTKNEWEIASKEHESMKQALKEELNAKDIKITSTHYSGVPGNLIEFSSKMEQAGEVLYGNMMYHTLYFQDKTIALQCMTGDMSENISKKIMNNSYNLFRLMGNDIILHNLFLDNPIKNDTKSLNLQDNNEPSVIEVAFILILSFAVYFLPSIIAYKRKTIKRFTILMYNIFLAWFLIMWFIILVWAIIGDNGNNNETTNVGKNEKDTKEVSNKDNGKVDWDKIMNTDSK